MDMYAGNFGPSNTSGMTVGTFFAVTCLFNGASSSMKVGTAAENTGNVGAGNMGGFCLGVYGDLGGNNSNIAVKEIIIRNVNDSTIRANDHAYLQTL